MSTSSSGWRPSWPTVRHLAAEFVLILAGVLTALFVDTWWKGRDDRALERTYLLQLLEDTRDNQQILERTITEYVESDARTGKLLMAFRDPARRGAPDSLADWSRMRVPTFDPITGTMRGLLETGQIRLIQRDAVRRAIIMTDAEITSAMTRVEHNDVRLSELLEQRTARMIAHLPTVPIPTRTGTRDEIGSGWRIMINYPGLLADPVAHATFQTVFYVQGNTIAILQALREPYARLRRQLERELGG